MRRRAERVFPLCKIRDETDSMAKAKLTKSSSYGVLRQSPYFKSDSVNYVIKEKKEQKKCYPMVQCIFTGEHTPDTYI